MPAGVLHPLGTFSLEISSLQMLANLYEAFPGVDFPMPEALMEPPAVLDEQLQQDDRVQVQVFPKMCMSLARMFDFYYQQLDILTAASILQQLAGALRQLHSKEPFCIVHHDVKEDNVLLQPLEIQMYLMWQLALGDLGIAAEETCLISRQRGTKGYNGMVLAPHQLKQLQKVLRNLPHIYGLVAESATAHPLFDWFGFSSVARILLHHTLHNHTASQPDNSRDTAAAAVGRGESLSAAAAVYSSCEGRIIQLPALLEGLQVAIGHFGLAHALFMACAELRASEQIAEAGAYSNAAEQAEADAQEERYKGLSLKQLQAIAAAVTGPMQHGDMVQLRPLAAAFKHKVEELRDKVLGITDEIIEATPDAVLRGHLQELAQCRVPPGEAGGYWVVQISTAISLQVVR
jgi:hypothetical protein